MLHKQSQNLNSLNSFINNEDKKDYRKEMNERQPEMKQEKVIQKDRSWAEPKTAQSRYGDTLARNSSSVRSSRCAVDGGITNNGGTKSQGNTSNKNTIWDASSLEKIAGTLSSRETTQIEKNQLIEFANSNKQSISKVLLLNLVQKMLLLTSLQASIL
jgi:uncharacterized protein (DUF4415 family)